MKTEIYYFSGTGNSYWIAKDIAERLKAELYSISSLKDEESITINSKSVGFIFPDYHSNLPNIVRKFMKG